MVKCPMTKNQKAFYEATVNKTLEEHLKDKENKEDAKEGIELNGNGMNDKRQKRKTKSKVDYSFFFNAGDDVSEKTLEKEFEKLRQIELARESAQAMKSAYDVKLDSADIRCSLKNRMMDLRKSTNHPYLIEYPLTEDGVFYRTDEELIEASGTVII